MIRRAAFENDPGYVGAVKLSLSITTLAIVLISWLFPSDAPLIGLKDSAPEVWIQLNTQLSERGISFAHFADRFSSRYELLNTFATLLECGVFALLLHRFDRSRPLFSHLSFALYCYSLWLLACIPLEFLLAAAHAVGVDRTLSMAMGMGMVAVLPGLLIVGLWRLYPAPWPRQLGRAAILLLLMAVLFVVVLAAISVGAMEWTKASFGF